MIWSYFRDDTARGLYRFYSVNPLHNRTRESKLGHGIKVDEDWWLGSGIYTGPVDLSL
jgi:hypothetical protein